MRTKVDHTTFYKEGGESEIYKVGMTVKEDGYYVCTPCGYRRYFVSGMRFPSCLRCMRKMFKRGLELWERIQI